MCTAPEIEDWVKLRHECSPAAMYLKLKDGANKDVEARMECLDPGSNQAFRLDSQKGFFNVMRRGPGGSATWVQFVLTENSIVVEDSSGKVLLRAHLTLTDKAECKLRLENGEELSPWQFRKRALEELFFNF